MILYSMITDPENSKPNTKADNVQIVNKRLNSPYSETERKLVRTTNERTEIIDVEIEPAK